MIQVTYTTTEAEFVEAQMLVFRLRSPKKFRNRWINLVGTSVLAFVLLLGGLFDIYVHVLAHATPSSFLVIVGLVVESICLYSIFDLITLHSLRKRLKAMYKRTHAGPSPIDTMIDETGWREETPGSNNTFVEWTGFCHRIETDTLFIAMRPDLMFNLIPKRALSPLDIASLRTLIETRIPQAPPGSLSM